MHGPRDMQVDQVVDRFRRAVNMSAPELRSWLDTPESWSVGSKPEPGAESVGHAAGRYIVDLLGVRPEQLTRSDLAHMRKVAGFVARHIAQRPDGDVRTTRWRYSLMNWGHDPLRSGSD